MRISECGTEVVSAFGERDKPAERVAAQAAAEAEAYLEAGVPLGRHLADQLLLPLALAASGAGSVAAPGGGPSSFRTVTPTPHTETNAWVIGRFLDVAVERVAEGRDRGRITVGSSG